MDARFVPHNSHLDDSKRFSEADPDLSQLSSLRYSFQFKILQQLPIDTPGIYTLCGAYRAGKTCLLKTWIKKLLNEEVPARSIVFFSCELIKDYHELEQLLKEQLSVMPSDKNLYVILDEVTQVRDWKKSIQALLNGGLLNNVTLMLSGSDMTLPKEVLNNFSNHRGTASQLDFQLNPLSFHETVLLKRGNSPKLSELYDELNLYLIHGGFLNVINDVDKNGLPQDKTLTSYCDWINKLCVARGKQEHYLRQILTAVIKNYNSQTTWNTLAQELTIDHPKTIGDYFALLESIGVVFVQYALLENTLKPAPKKARKLMFTDPFLYHAFQAWLSPSKNHFDQQIKESLENHDTCSKLVEACVITHFRRYFPTFYIKAEGEVDLAYVDGQRFWPIETTWSSQIRSKDLKQILKYPNGRILTKTDHTGIIEQIKTEPLPLALWQLEDLNELEKMS